MEEYLRKVQETAQYIGSVIKTRPQIGIVLGSGLGPLVNILENTLEIDYADIPNFPQTTVIGHSGKLVYGPLGGKQVLAMKGRFHYYEGYDISQVVFHIRVFRLLGISNLLVTNAAGAINTGFKPGDLMLITDHIGLFAPSPLRGPNIEEFGTRFPDMCCAYDPGLRDIAKETAKEQGIAIKEGVYAYAQGPMFETPAEIKALRTLGADAVGMSTVPEVVTARHSGMRVLGISLMTNMAAGVKDKTLNHNEVMDVAKEAEQRFATLVGKIIEKWDV